MVDEHISAQRGRIATLALPDAKIPTGSYQWRVRAKDQDGAYSGWSAVKSFEVDRDRPSKPPTVASPEYPNGDAGWPAVTGKARVTAGKFTFGAAGIGDVVAYRYRTSWDPQERGVNVSSVPGSSATVTITPPAVGPGYVYAYSLDRVGNRSDERAYLLYANGTGAKDRPGDLNGDGNADAWSLDPSGTLRSYLGQGNGKFGTAAYGGASLQGGLISHRGDWDNDGIEDLLVRRYDDVDKRQKLYVYPNTGYGIVRPEDAYELTVACPRHAAEAGDCQAPARTSGTTTTPRSWPSTTSPADRAPSTAPTHSPTCWSARGTSCGSTTAPRAGTWTSRATPSRSAATAGAATP